MIKNKLIKIGSFALLSVGILAAIFLFVLGVVLFLAYPEASVQKKVIIAAVFLIASLVVALLTISLFESMKEFLVVEDEIAEMEDKTKN